MRHYPSVEGFLKSTVVVYILNETKIDIYAYRHQVAGIFATFPKVQSLTILASVLPIEKKSTPKSFQYNSLSLDMQLNIAVPVICLKYNETSYKIQYPPTYSVCNIFYTVIIIVGQSTIDRNCAGALRCRSISTPERSGVEV